MRRGTEIFERMLDGNDPSQKPNAVTFTTLLTMWANSKLPEASNRVVEIFKHMTLLGARMDTVGYSSLLSALGDQVTQMPLYEPMRSLSKCLRVG